MMLHNSYRFNNFFVVGLKDEIRKVCQEEFLVCGEGDEQGSAWMEKVNLIVLHYKFSAELYIFLNLFIIYLYILYFSCCTESTCWRNLG